jgi:hypothetical protein
MEPRNGECKKVFSIILFLLLKILCKKIQLNSPPPTPLISRQKTQVYRYAGGCAAARGTDSEPSPRRKRAVWEKTKKD